MPVQGIRINHEQLIKPSQELLGGLAANMPRRFSDMSVETAEEGIKIIRRIIADEATDSGRLAASIGIYDPSFLVQPDGDSSPADAYWHQSTRRGSQHFVEFGTNVPYAIFIELGFAVTNIRVVFIAGRFVTIHPFSFQGIHAFERGMTEVETNELVLAGIFRRNMRLLGFR